MSALNELLPFGLTADNLLVRSSFGYGIYNNRGHLVWSS